MKYRIAAVLACGLIGTSMAEAQDLSALYQVYEQKGYSTLGMEELNRSVRFSAVALEVSTNLKGAAMLAAGDDDGYELARLRGADAGQDARLKKLRTGEKFDAECVLQFTSGSDYLSFSQCIFD
ncbi:MAG: hypothetical protein LBE53_10545 [Paucimonas sp.]|uniref:hypothetical protein n=1 Tax=Pantoea sp. Cy-639 TaxID=2608360 RepID=UPI00196680DF|nr:hypothetical protein [Pantoea sp. Cy-639]MDR2307619.1 hypothetical protein [Paucimonas sp.]